MSADCEAQTRETRDAVPIITTTAYSRKAIDFTATEFTTETWLTDKVPFGVAGYRNGMSRTKDGMPQGGRSMELKVAESGTGAKSAIEK